LKLSEAKDKLKEIEESKKHVYTEVEIKEMIETKKTLKGKLMNVAAERVKLIADRFNLNFFDLKRDVLKDKGDKDGAALIQQQIDALDKSGK
jgi:hypothetical protein